ncbi:MAG: PglZ domain-containing protein [Bacteroidales bacterium]|nr:PglZ domain-containing protein [Bacteroidales bacterium]MDZ4204289.1 PglZ domain-containing protein [Bacteroidales bacterium]
MIDKINILWVDDEIDLLKPHILFLNHKGYDVSTANNGSDAIDVLKTKPFDIIFLDENMPGLSGIETLTILKEQYPNLPVVMITKSEEESIMEDAIGSNITDYLIKPVNPNQILLSLKKSLENKKIIREKTTYAYQQEFQNIGMEITNNLDHAEWVEVYRKLVSWELKLEKSEDEGIQEVLRLQKAEANQVFSRFIEKNYLGWVNGSNRNRPSLSHTIFKEKLFPYLEGNQPVFLLLIDNLRFDQWKIIQPVIEEFFRTDSEDLFYSILPSTTQYSRNALFSGLMPSEIEKKYPRWWVNEGDEGTKNQFEGELLGEWLKRFGKDIKSSYNKVLNLAAGRKLVESLPNLLVNKLNVIVYNFVDMLSHARTEMEIIKELADDEPAYRSLTLSWFIHSPLLEIIRMLADKKVTVIITTDHGSVKVQNPVKIIGDKNTTANLRYKTGRSLDFNSKEVFEVRNPEDAFLPRGGVSSSFVFCRRNDFFAYPNNFNYYANYYRNTFQHGGISLEELIIPFVVLKNK